MKTIILAGGWGSRLGQISEHIPKPMVHIGNRPMLWHIMKLYSSFGYNDFIISLGVKGNIIKEYFYNFKQNNNDFTIETGTGQITYLGKRDDANWKITLIDTGIETLKIDRIKLVEQFLEDDVNMLTYGDGVSDVNIDELVAFHRSHGKTVTFTGVHPSGRFGEFEERDGEVLSFREKPDHGKAYINGGFMVFNRNLFDYLQSSKNSDLTKDALEYDFETDTLENLAKQGEVMVYKHEGSWECMDNERDVLRLNSLWNSGNAFWKVW